MVNENDMQPPQNSGVNIMNGFALDEQNQDGFFKTTRVYLEPAKSKNQLLGTSIVNTEQAMDTATILAKAENTRNRIARVENKSKKKEPPKSKKEDGIDYTDMTYAETHVYKFLEVSKSINGIARKEGVGILTGNYQPYIDRGASSFLPRKKG